MLPQRRDHLRAFTLIEILLAIAILSLLIGLLVVGISRAFKVSSIKAHEQALANLKIAIDQFRQEFNFPPPLVKDEVPFPGNPIDRIPVYIPSNPADGIILRRDAEPSDAGSIGARTEYYELRFSVLSLPYYISGACEFKPSNDWQVPIDGVSGPGMLQALPDGSFKVPAGLKSASSTNRSSGRVYPAFFDASKATLQLVQGDNNRAEYRDRKNVPYRYYRWLPDAVAPPVNINSYSDHGLRGLRAYLNVPVIVGDPESDMRLRDATWAVVWAGSDGLFGDETLEDLGNGLGRTVDAAGELRARMDATKDNVVEVGK